MVKKMNPDRFNPIQPEMKSNSQCYEEFQPSRHAHSNVSLYYQFKTNNKLQGALPVIPDGCLDLLFCLNPSKPEALVAASPMQRYTFQFQPNSLYFGVRLYPEQNTIHLQCSFKELLQHQQLPLFDVLNFSPALLENITLQKSFEDRIRFLQSFLITNQFDSLYDQTLIEYCLKDIYHAHGSLNLKQLSVKTGYSDRYIRTKFEDYIGFSPKQFSQIVRFQYAVNELISHQPHLNEIIDHNGFYDEAHFYKGFKKYASLTPKQYQELFMKADTLN